MPFVLLVRINCPLHFRNKKGSTTVVNVLKRIPDPFRNRSLSFNVGLLQIGCRLDYEISVFSRNLQKIFLSDNLTSLSKYLSRKDPDQWI